MNDKNFEKITVQIIIRIQQRTIAPNSSQFGGPQFLGPNFLTFLLRITYCN